MYVYRTKGTCPSEIHFHLDGNTLRGVRFVGGGCKGNLEFISRLLEGQDVNQIIPLLQGIKCRNDTSCPDQLFQAILLAKKGEFEEAEVPRVYEALEVHRKVAVIAELDGNLPALEAVTCLPVDAVYCLGNLTGPHGANDAVVEAARNGRIVSAQGPFDRLGSCVKPANREYLLQAPSFLRFQLGELKVLGFYGGFIQDLPGFSDFSQYALELLMVCNLSDYLRKEEVYPALLSMTQQFTVDAVLFAHTRQWKHVRLGQVDFVNVGPVQDAEGYRYVLLEAGQEGLKVSFELVRGGGEKEHA